MGAELRRLSPAARARRRGMSVLLAAGGAFQCGVLGCTPPISPPEPTPPGQDPITDDAGPVLETDPITAPQPASSPILFEAYATDPSGVYAVYLHFKPVNTDWKEARLPESQTSPGYFSVELPPEQFRGASSLSYYLEAADATPYRNASLSPTSGAELPYRFNLVQ